VPAGSRPICRCTFQGFMRKALAWTAPRRALS